MPKSFAQPPFQLKKGKIIFTMAILVFFSAMGFLILGIKLKSDLVSVYKNRQSVMIYSLAKLNRI